jgi:tetratricopeptide (TPR) repeat protein
MLVRVSWVLAWSVLTAVPMAGAQAADDGADERGREIFAAAVEAFANAEYEVALDLFRRAYEVSGRAELLYNVGLAADRLRRDREALEAFESFHAQVPEHPRRRDVERRIEVLRAVVTDSGTPPSVEPDGVDAVSIVGSISLAVAGATGIALGAFGIASSECLARDEEGCVEARETSWGAVALYGGLGVAALGGAIVWLVVALAGDSEAEDVAWTGAWSF